jgi:hypothetical protein
MLSRPHGCAATDGLDTGDWFGHSGYGKRGIRQERFIVDTKAVSNDSRKAKSSV